MKSGHGGSGGGGAKGGLYTIGGTLTAASGSIASGLQLALDTTFVGPFPAASGKSFTWYFASQVANGAAFIVTIASQPTPPRLAASHLAQARWLARTSRASR